MERIFKGPPYTQGWRSLRDSNNSAAAATLQWIRSVLCKARVTLHDLRHLKLVHMARFFSSQVGARVGAQVFTMGNTTGSGVHATILV